MRFLRSKYTQGKNDQNKYFRCKRCGFINNIDRTALPERATENVVDAYVRSNPGDPIDVKCEICTLECVDIPGGVTRDMEDGTDEVYFTTRNYFPVQGCNFCGQVNQ
jgi:hypothetical protein